MLLCLLQNAWSGYYTRIGRPGEEIHRHKDRVWHRDNWIDATWASASGRKLALILKDIPDDQLWLDDTTLEVADKASGIKPPDLEHIRSVLRERQITAVVACGKQAGKAIDEVWTGSVLKIPHPAMRLLSNPVLVSYNIGIRDMLRDLEHDRTYRAELDTRGIIVASSIMTEVDLGRSWIR